jgi:TetR/AcrR family transcriptional regulator, ethionamide resistance regulator
VRVMEQPSTAVGRRSGGGRKGDAREVAILDAAAELLVRDGVETMTVEAIAQEVGITRGALYFYFGSKQSVLTALVARSMADIELGYGQVALEPPDGDERAVVRDGLRATEQAWRAHGPVMQAAVELGPTVPAIAALWEATVDSASERFAAVLAGHGAPDRPGPDGARALSRMLCPATAHAYYVSYAASGAEYLGEVTETCTRVWLLVLAGLRG